MGLTGILAHRDIFDVMQAVFNMPMATFEVRQLSSSTYVTGQTRAFSGPAIVALSGLGRIAAYHPDHAWARRWLSDTIATIRETTGIWESTIARAVWGRAYLGWGEYASAAAQLSDDLRFYQKAGARRAIAEALEGLAACAGAQGQWEHALRWWAAADRLRSKIGAPLWPVDQADRERRMTHVRAALSLEAFDAAWAVGQEMVLEQAIAEALAFTDLPTS